MRHGTEITGTFEKDFASKGTACAAIAPSNQAGNSFLDSKLPSTGLPASTQETQTTCDASETGREDAFKGHRLVADADRADSMTNSSKDVGATSVEEKRVHSSYPGAAYTFQEFVDFFGGDADYARATWAEARVDIGMGRCVGGCGFRTTCHLKYCCMKCIGNPGKAHSECCERKVWPGQPFGTQTFMLCFPSASTLGGRCVSGITELSVEAAPGDVAQAQRAATIFRQHGFVILRKALPAPAALEVFKACCSVHDAVTHRDPSGRGSRGAGRYSFNTCTGSGQCLHLWPFVEHLVDNKFVLDVLDEIYACTAPPVESHKSDDTNENSSPPYFISRVSGDFCCGWVEHFQPLHSDMGEAQPLSSSRPHCEEDEYSNWFGSQACDARPIHDKTRPPVVAVNFAVQPLTRWNGPMRIVTWEDMESFYHEHQSGPPSLSQELHNCPEWLASRIFPLEAGDALVRDVRIWHGGCPNLSGEARYLPCVEVSSPEYYHWFSSMFESQALERGEVEKGEDIWWGALPAEFAARIVDPRALRCCEDYIEKDPEGEANLRAGDVNWLSHFVERPQMPCPFPEAELGAMEVELAQLLAALCRLVAKNWITDEGSGLELCKSRLLQSLRALEEGELLPRWLLHDTPEVCMPRLVTMANSLRCSLTIDSPSATMAAGALASALETLIANATFNAVPMEENAGHSKRRRQSL
eukprot:gnl/TRDRNA2_/TRDRNA2_167756_c0_seq1.p1 gnl/TRDRNA2_/TRDRNA2_167756_c0~~gnl/TRDRNA2_/TRDRNA2_167756_c0_seq1.p1  ORF type:complete len:699 (+),score=59.72 gnl/TRDRNA2_/TRDRNA2_167756_c0_seq1:83-2179(+)